MRRNPFAAPDADFTGYNFWLRKLKQIKSNFISAEMAKLNRLLPPLRTMMKWFG